MKNVIKERFKTDDAKSQASSLLPRVIKEAKIGINATDNAPVINILANMSGKTKAIV